MFILKGMHRKSLEAAQHLKEDGCNNSDHEETTSLRTDTSDTSATSGTTTGQQPAPTVSTPSGTTLIPSGSNPPSSTHNPAQSDTNKTTPESSTTHYDDPEVFRNNSIACLRAKAQEHSAKLLNHGLMLQVRSLANMTHAQNNCDANANNLNLHHPDIVNSDTNSSLF